MINISLKNKVALITGTTRGLGEALAEALAEAGATLVALDRSDNDRLRRFCEEKDVPFKRLRVDFLKTSKGELDGVVHTVLHEFSHIDILVNNAGITRRAELEDFTEEDWREVLKVNLDIPFYLSRALSPHFIRQKSGKIINIASILSYQGGLRVPAYVASKHGIVGLTQSFAMGLARYGINVNAIAPGFMATDMTRPLQEEAKRNESILSRVPAGRWGEKEDLKGALLFLASDLSRFVNGAVIPVDGGWLVS